MNRQHTSLIEKRLIARHHPSAFLLAAQVISLGLYVLFGDTSSGRALLGAFGVVVLALVVWVINRSSVIRWIAWVLVVAAFALSILTIFIVEPLLLAASTFLEAIIYFYAAGSLMYYMMEDTRVTTDELFAAGAAFTLLAWGFAYLYQLCQIFVPGSFMGAVNPESARTFLELLSLSFTNLSATGLGDVMPVRPLARVLVMLEQFSGIAYVAMVVSRLVGMMVGRQKGTG